MTSRRVHRGDGARAVNPHDHVSQGAWWVPHAQPESRSEFMAAARAVAIQREHLDNIREARKVSVGIHLWQRGKVKP